MRAPGGHSVAAARLCLGHWFQQLHLQLAAGPGPRAPPCWKRPPAAATAPALTAFLVCPFLQSLVGSDNFTHILRVLNTNVDGKQKIMYALTAIKGLGRRFSNICCKKAEVDLNKR